MNNKYKLDFVNEIKYLDVIKFIIKDNIKLQKDDINIFFKYNIIMIPKILEEILILLAKLILLFQVNFKKVNVLF